MIKEVFRQNFPFGNDFNYSYKSTKYLDVLTRSGEDGNLVFEFKVKNFYRPFIGKQAINLLNDYDDYTRFFTYVNQNNHESAFIAIGFQSVDIYRIWDIFVEPPFQHLGIGTEMLKHIEKIARGWSAKVIVVECRSSNYPAIRFFQKNKFLITGFYLVHKSRNDLIKHDIQLQMSKLLE